MTTVTIRLVGLFAIISISVYSCAWYSVEHEKQTASMMKTCMDAGHVWKTSWNRSHYCE